MELTELGNATLSDGRTVRDTLIEISNLAKQRNVIGMSIPHLVLCVVLEPTQTNLRFEVMGNAPSGKAVTLLALIHDLLLDPDTSVTDYSPQRGADA